MTSISKSPATAERFITGIRQVCLVTDDFDRTLHGLAMRLGIGPFKCWHYEPPKLFGTKLRGKEVPWTMKLAFAWVGKMQLEVIQPVNGPTIFDEFLAKGRGSFHHLQVITDGLNLARAVERFEAIGCSVEQEAYANVAGQLGPIPIPPIPQFAARQLCTHFAYMNAEEIAKIMLEVSQFPPGVPFRLGINLAKGDFWVPAPEMPGDTLVRAGLINEIVKVGIVTRDLDGTIAQYSNKLGIGPWRVSVLESPKLAETTLRGQTAQYKVRIAHAVAGDTVLELVQPMEGPSLYAEWLDQKGEGAHYLGVTTDGASWDDVSKQFASAGCPAVMEGTWEGMYRFAFMDTTPHIGTALEVLSLPAERFLEVAVQDLS